MSDEDVVGGGEVQDALFDVDPDWKDLWQGMPDYSHEDLMPWQTVMVHFKTQKDREDFARIVGQTLHAKTKFIWHPKAEIRKAADKVYAGGPKVAPRYPVYIISKGRWESRLTSKALEWIGVPYNIVVEPQELEQYAAVIPREKILVLPFSNLGLGGIPARNWVWEHAIATGAARHWILDDNISGFCRFQDNLKVEVDSGATFRAVEDFVDRYENVAMAAFNYDYFAPRKQGAKIRPVTLNTRCYSGILLSNTMTPHRWRGRYNEDTDISLRILKDGLCTVLFNAFLMYKKPTLTMKGGNTDELYAGAEAAAAEWEAHADGCDICVACKDGYGSRLPPCEEGRQILEKDGRWRMAEHLREQHPECTTVERKWGRWQHQVDYRLFNPALGRNVLKLKEGYEAPAEANEYGMELDAMPPELGGHDARNAAMGQPKHPPAEVTAQAEQAPAQTSALDFLRLQAAQEPEPVQPGKAPASGGKLLLDQPEQPDAASEAVRPEPEPGLEELSRGSALELKIDLGARGHKLLTRDGKFFVSEASRLTPMDRVAIKTFRDELVAMAEPWIEAPTAIERRQQGFNEHANPFEDYSPTQTVVQFLGSEPPLVDSSWVPDEPPDLTGVDGIVLNFATDGLEWSDGARPVGLTVSTLDGKLTRFLPFAFQGGGNLDEGAVRRWAKEHLQGKYIINSKVKFDVHHARVWGVDLEAQGCRFSDVQHTAALLDDHRKRFAIDLLAEDYMPNLPKVPRLDERQHASYHASSVAAREKHTVELVWRLRDAMYPELEKQELMEIQRLEDDVIPAVVEMEKNGSPIDVELLDQFQRELKAAYDEIMWDVSREAGFAFEHTPKGWKRLIEQLGLPVPDSFDEATLNQVDHPLVRKGQRASQHASLNSKVFEPYKKNVDSSGILRYDINQLRSDDGGTVSGRFSIEYVQQVPNRDNHAAAFGDRWDPRRLYVPGSGKYLEADAAQIEFRLFAHYANNPRILADYAKEDPEDPATWTSFHKTTWAMMKTYKPDMLYSNVKNFNFAGQYGARSIKLAVMMGHITEREGDEIRRAKRWNDPRLNLIHEIEAAYAKMLPEREELLNRASHLAKPECDEYCKKGDALHRKYAHRGYVKTLRGRRSRYPNNYKPYTGLNRVLQGTGADVMKLKLAVLHRERKNTGLLMRITNHDAVLGDATESHTRQRVSEVLNEQSYPELKVRILWECHEGVSWADCKG